MKTHKERWMDPRPDREKNKISSQTTMGRSLGNQCAVWCNVSPCNPLSDVSPCRPFDIGRSVAPSLVPTLGLPAGSDVVQHPAEASLL